ncbi:G-protein coupled receptor Mth2-like isoform X3 [Stomoxys calcitrans]|uniref:G-protein coupled receptor Mth2-like isoform X3 n=1 Tax=Stomoxys calcitrans TaxID=35570 RepID=UPI0027E23E17|nr:G-protein coupled receptor Mth2-like isoform X3 [Stomoxys calcitrans]
MAKIMNCSIFFALKFLVLILTPRFDTSVAKCLYNYSVDLTGVTPNENGAYPYEDVVIPPHLVFDYKMPKRNCKNDQHQLANIQKRGCICMVKKCLRVCTESFRVYYQESIKVKSDIDIGYTKNITLINGSISEFNLMLDFHHIMGSVCEKEYVLVPEMEANDKWTLYENGSLLRLSDMRLMSEMEYCFDVSEFEIDGNLYFLVNPSNCASDTLPNNLIINGYAMLFSVPFFVLTILYLYCCMNIEKPYSKSLISYLSALAVSYSLISFMIISKIKFEPITCQILGFIIYYTMICYLTWTCIISYDLWYSYSNFGATSSFLKYTIVGWMLPLIMTLLTAIAQMTIPDPDFQPGIVAISCTLDNTRWSALIYLYIPCILALIYTLTMYIRTLVFIKRSNDVVQQNYDADSTSFGVFLNFRLFSFMCLSWIVDIVSFFWQATHQKEKNSGVYLPDVLNASQGIFMFMTLIMHAKFWKNVCRRSEKKTSKKG